MLKKMPKKIPEEVRVKRTPVEEAPVRIGEIMVLTVVEEVVERPSRCLVSASENRSDLWRH